MDADSLKDKNLPPVIFDASISLILYVLTSLYAVLLCILLITGRLFDTVLFASLVIMLMTDAFHYFSVKGYRYLPIVGLTMVLLIGVVSSNQEGRFIDSALYLMQGQIIITLAYLLFSFKSAVSIILFLSVLFSAIGTAYFAATPSLMILSLFLIQGCLFVFGGLSKKQLQADLDTQRDHITQSLNKTQWQFKMLAESTQDMILMLDTSYRILFVNPPLQRIVVHNDLMGKLLHSTSIPAEIAIPLRNAIQEAETDHTASYVEMRLEANFDGSKPVFLDGEVFPQLEGKTLTGFLVILKDMTLQENSEELFAQQAQADALKRFMREAAHDLITPLTTMKTNLYLMQHTTEDIKQLRRIELLEDQTDHIERSTQALLKMTRLEGAQFQMESVFLNSFLSNVIAAHRTLVISRDQNIVFEPDNRIAEVMLDVNEFQFVIREMLMNALVHSESGDTTLVRTKLTEDNVIITIQDEGSGIDPKDIEHIFEPFYRASAREIAKGGIGLGLTLSKWIVDIHHGRIDVESELDEGSSFVIYLPLTQSHQNGKPRKKRRTTRPVPAAATETSEDNIITRQ